MKCDSCPSPATYDITDIINGVPVEHHLCQDCAKKEIPQHVQPPKHKPARNSIDFFAENADTLELEKHMASHGVPGISLAVIDHGRIHATRVYGVAEIHGSPITAATRFQAASISKPITALAAMRLVEMGKLQLDTDLNDSLISWKIPRNAFSNDQHVTLRTVLTHTSGLTIHGFRGYSSAAPLPQLLDVLNGTPPANSKQIEPASPPGVAFRYSGGAFCVLQQAIIDVTQTPFPEAMNNLVLAPLGMHDSTFDCLSPDDAEPPAATGHRAGDPIVGKWHSYPESAAAGLWTTPTDLARFILALQDAWRNVDAAPVSHNIAAQMLTPQANGWGLGMILRGAGKDLGFLHGGMNAGFVGQIVGFPESGQAAAVMVNSENGAGLLLEILSSLSAKFHWPAPDTATCGVA